MRSQFFQRVFVFSAAVILSAVSLNGCKTQIDDPTPGDFAQIRAMNFATCSAPFDIYIEQDGAPLDTLPTAQNLGFGLSTVYRNNLFATAAGTVYHVIVRRVNNRASTLAQATITVHPGEKWSVAIYYDPTTSTYPLDVIQDANNGAGAGVTDKVYVRFLNTTNLYPMPLAVRINDNLDGDVIGNSAGYAYRAHSDYQALPFKTDTSYTFFIVDPTGGDTVISRLAGLSFDPGSYHTITYCGDPCQTFPQNKLNPAGNPLDTLRIHNFDDNYGGNDLTSPLIPQTLRYNFVNGLIVHSAADQSKIRFYNQLGIVINNDGNITFPNLSPSSIAPDQSSTPWGAQPVDPSPSKVYSILFTSTQLTQKIDVKAFRTDNVGAGGRGQLLADYLVGRRTDIVSDIPASLILTDTALAIAAPAVDSSTVQAVAVPIPDNAVNTVSKLVLVNALAKGIYGAKTANLNAVKVTYSVNGTQDPNFINKSPLIYDNKFTTQPGQITIDATLNPIPPSSPLKMDVTTTFTANPGKIYEIVLLGQRATPDAAFQPHLVIICTNPTTAHPN